MLLPLEDVNDSLAVNDCEVAPVGDTATLLEAVPKCVVVGDAVL